MSNSKHRTTDRRKLQAYRGYEPDEVCFAVQQEQESVSVSVEGSDAENSDDISMRQNVMYESHQHPRLVKLNNDKNYMDFSGLKENKSYDSEDYTEMYEKFEAEIIKSKDESYQYQHNLGDSAAGNKLLHAHSLEMVNMIEDPAELGHKLKSNVSRSRELKKCGFITTNNSKRQSTEPNKVMPQNFLKAAGAPNHHRLTVSPKNNLQQSNTSSQYQSNSYRFFTPHQRKIASTQQLFIGLGDTRLSRPALQPNLQQQQPSLFTIQQSQQIFLNKSPTSRQKMSPRTNQPSGLALTVPLQPTFSPSTSKRYQQTKPDEGESSDIPICDDEGTDGPSCGVSESQCSSQKVEKYSHMTSHQNQDQNTLKQQKQQQLYLQQQIIQDSESSYNQKYDDEGEAHDNGESQSNFVMNNEEFLSFGLDRLGNFPSPHSHTKSVATGQFESNPASGGGGKRQQKITQQITKKKQPVVIKSRYLGTRSPRLNTRTVPLTIDTDQISADSESRTASQHQPTRQFSQRDSQEFLLKQKQFIEKKQEKILKAQLEKIKKERQDFEINATFRPKLLTRKKSRSPVTKSNTSPRGLTPTKNRTLKQFITDQQKFQIKSQRKIDDQRAQKNHDEQIQITLKPQINPNSQKICKQIQSEFQALVNQYPPQHQNNFVDLQMDMDQQEYNIQLQHQNQDNSHISDAPQSVTTINTSAFATKKKKSPSNKNMMLMMKAVSGNGMLSSARSINKASTSPVAKQIMAHKKALAKAVPIMPTFAPKICKKSHEMIMAKEKLKSSSPRLTKKTTVKTSTNNDMFTNGDIGLENMIIQQRVVVQQSLFVGPQNDNSYRYNDDMAESQSESVRQEESFNEQRQNLTAKQKTTKLGKKNFRSEPRIAEVKAQQQQIKSAQEKHEFENKTRKRNENLVLRNFKKEFDAIMIDLKLGSTKVKDSEEFKQIAQNSKNYLTSQLQSLNNQDTASINTQYYSTLSHEVTIQEDDDPVEVDLALILYQLGFLTSLTPVRDPSGTLVDQFTCRLEDKDQKNIFKTNLFICLAAIQSINLKEHFKLYDTFGLLQHHILEDITQQVDLRTSQLGLSHISYKNNSTQRSTRTTQNNTTLQSGETATPVCQTSLLIEALLQFALQPFPFSINHSHLVKMHLTFMSFFLNRKDNISKGYRMNLVQQENDKFNYQPQINETKLSVSTSKDRAPLTEPNRYYDELKRNIKERACKLSSMKAENDKQNMNECTFKPQVNLKSSKIAYKQVSELHLRHKEFNRAYTIEQSDKKSQNSSQEESQRRSEQLITQQQSIKDEFPNSRIGNRINKIVNEYVADKRAGVRQDITTEQREFEKSKKELIFRPNIDKSKLSLKLAVKKSPKNVQSRILNQKSSMVSKSPTAVGNQKSPKNCLKSSSAGSLAVKKKTLMFSKIVSPQQMSEAAIKKDTYSSKLQQQLLKRKKSSQIVKKTEMVQQKNVLKGKSTPVKKVAKQDQQQYQKEAAIDEYPTTTDNRKTKFCPSHIDIDDLEASSFNEPGNSPDGQQSSQYVDTKMPEVIDYIQQVKEQDKQRLLSCLIDGDDGVDCSSIEQPSPVVQRQALRAPPSVADIQQFLPQSQRQQHQHQKQLQQQEFDSFQQSLNEQQSEDYDQMQNNHLRQQQINQHINQLEQQLVELSSPDLSTLNRQNFYKINYDSSQRQRFEQSQETNTERTLTNERTERGGTTMGQNIHEEQLFMPIPATGNENYRQNNIYQRAFETPTQNVEQLDYSKSGVGIYRNQQNNNNNNTPPPFYKTQSQKEADDVVNTDQVVPLQAHNMMITPQTTKHAPLVQIYNPTLEHRQSDVASMTQKSEFPAGLLMMTSQTDNASQSANFLGDLQKENNNSLVDWTAEFAKVVSDVITVDQTTVKNNTNSIRPTQMSLSGHNFSPDHSHEIGLGQKLQMIKRNTTMVNKGKTAAANEFHTEQLPFINSNQRSPTLQSIQPRIIIMTNNSSPRFHNNELNAQGKANVVQPSIEDDQEEESDQQCQPREISTTHSNIFNDKSNSSAQMTATGQPYLYVNESASQDDESEQSSAIIDCQNNTCVPRDNNEPRPYENWRYAENSSSMQLGMLGADIEEQEERMIIMSTEKMLRKDQMPRIEKETITRNSNTNQTGKSGFAFNLDNQNRLTIQQRKSPPELLQYQMMGQSEEYKLDDDYDSNDDSSDSSQYEQVMSQMPTSSHNDNTYDDGNTTTMGVTPIRRTPNGFDFHQNFNDSSHLTEIRISNLDEQFSALNPSGENTNNNNDNSAANDASTASQQAESKQCRPFFKAAADTEEYLPTSQDDYKDDANLFHHHLHQANSEEDEEV